MHDSVVLPHVISGEQKSNLSAIFRRGNMADRPVAYLAVLQYINWLEVACRLFSLRGGRKLPRVQAATNTTLEPQCKNTILASEEHEQYGEYTRWMLDACQWYT